MRSHRGSGFQPKDTNASPHHGSPPRPPPHPREQSECFPPLLLLILILRNHLSPPQNSMGAGLWLGSAGTCPCPCPQERETHLRLPLLGKAGSTFRAPLTWSNGPNTPLGVQPPPIGAPGPSRVMLLTLPASRSPAAPSDARVPQGRAPSPHLSLRASCPGQATTGQKHYHTSGTATTWFVTSPEMSRSQRLWVRSATPGSRQGPRVCLSFCSTIPWLLASLSRRGCRRAATASVLARGQQGHSLLKHLLL